MTITCPLAAYAQLDKPLVQVKVLATGTNTIIASLTEALQNQRTTVNVVGS